jgi:phage terminase Nu1 subunit (DNA packaging protein)
MSGKKYGDAKDLAGLLGVSRPRITALIKRGIFGDVAKRKKDGTYRIDLEAAAAIARQNIDPAQPAGKIKGADSSARGVKPTGGIDYVTARALNEQYKAAVKKLEYEERIGKLVDAKKVQEIAFDTARRVRDSLLNIPDRLSALLAAEPNEIKVRELLTKEIRQALSELVDNNGAAT